MSVDSVEESKDVRVDENLSQVETANGNFTETDMPATNPGQEKKPVRGRKAKAVESKAALDKKEAPEPSEEPAIPARAKGRRGKTAEAAAPPAVRQTTRGRTAKSTESKKVELTEESNPQPSKVALKPRRGRNAKTVSDVDVEMPQEVLHETEKMLEPKGLLYL